MKVSKRDGRRVGLSAVRAASDGLPDQERARVMQGAARYFRAQKGQATVRRVADAGMGGGMGGMMGGGDGVYMGAPMWYNPLIGSQDKYYFPTSQERQNAIWRMYYEMDPVLGSATDLFSDLPWSDFTLAGVKDKSVLRVFEECLDAIKLRSILPGMTRELLTKGKVIPHLIFSNAKGYWIHCAIQDPSYVQVTGTGMSGMPPLLDLIPTPEMQFMAKSADPRLQKLRSSLSPELLMAIGGGHPIPLSDINATYIARKSAPYDIMGTSLYSRVFKIVMLEDSLYQAAISVARRAAVPLRIFKLGDPNAGWFPQEEDYDAFLAQLEQAELDPASTLIYHFGLEVEYAGVTDKMPWNIGSENEFITSTKLIAMGVPEALIKGEASFASAEAGLQVTIERLSALRQKFMTEWITNKVLKPVAQANMFYQTTHADVLHNVIKRKPALSESDLVIPAIRWHKQLEVRDTFLLEVYKDLMNRGFVSNKSYAAMAGGIDLEEEVENLAEDRRLRERAEEILGTPPGEQGQAVASQRRVGRLLVGAHQLLRDGKTSVPEMKDTPPSSDAISQVLEREGVDQAASIIDRMAREIANGASKRKMLEKHADKLVTPWGGAASQLLSGV